LEARLIAAQIDRGKGVEAPLYIFIDAAPGKAFTRRADAIIFPDNRFESSGRSRARIAKRPAE
jgi:hypothetical protein